MSAFFKAKPPRRAIGGRQTVNGGAGFLPGFEDLDVLASGPSSSRMQKGEKCIQTHIRKHCCQDLLSVLHPLPYQGVLARRLKARLGVSLDPGREQVPSILNSQTEELASLLRSAGAARPPQLLLSKLCNEHTCPRAPAGMGQSPGTCVQNCAHLTRR